MIRDRSLLIVGLALLLVAACTVRDYTVEIPPGVSTRLPVEAAAGLGLAKLAEWEQEARNLGFEIRTAPRILRIYVDPTGIDQRFPEDRHIPGLMWIVDAEGTFIFPRGTFRSEIGDSGTMVFEDATGQMLAHSGTPR